MSLNQYLIPYTHAKCQEEKGLLSNVSAYKTRHNFNPKYYKLPPAKGYLSHSPNDRLIELENNIKRQFMLNFHQK